MYLRLCLFFSSRTILREENSGSNAGLGSILGAAGSGLSTLGGLVTGLVGSKRNLQAQREANQMNLRIAQMNNDFNAAMMQKQMDYNLDMWNRSNEYNSASAQRKRLESAGLNPYMMMNGGSAGTASNAMSINPPTAQSVSVQPSQNQLLQVGAALMSSANPLTVYAQLKQQLSDANVAASTVNDRILQQQLSNEALIASTAGVLKDNLLKDIDSKYRPALYSGQISTMMADVALKYAQGDLTKVEVHHEVYKMAKTAFEIAGLKTDNDLKALQYKFENAVYDYRVDYENYRTQSELSDIGVNNVWQLLSNPEKLYKLIHGYRELFLKLKDEINGSDAVEHIKSSKEEKDSVWNERYPNGAPKRGDGFFIN